MKLQSSRVLITGAAGGLGSELARQLVASGAALLLADRDAQGLEQLRSALGGETQAVVADLTSTAGIDEVVRAAQAFRINVLINNAGISAFGLLDQQQWTDVERLLTIALDVPIRLTQALLPWLKAQPAAAVVNVGSTFGSIPFAGFAVYSAAKAGLRGFSQALRRELADTSVAVVHIAPRAIDTPLNSPAVVALNRAIKSKSDSPEKVAGQILSALGRNIRELHIGFPERFFAWLNGFAPGLVDQGVAGKLSIIKQHATTRQ